MKKLLMTTAALAAFCAGPASISSTDHLGPWSLVSVAEAGNGNSHSNGIGNSGGNGNANSSNAGNSDRGKADSNGKAVGNPNTPNDDTQDVDSDASDTRGKSGSANSASAKEQNLHAVLGRINSIGRNVNALMQSKDPHLTAIRAYIVNGAELAKAETAADAAQAQYDAALAAFTDAGLTGDAATTLGELTTALTPELSSTDPAAAATLAAEIDLAKAVVDAQTTLTSAEARVAQYSVLASDAALADALAAMSNRKLTSADITPATLDWSKAVLGVGDATGAIDAWVAETE